MTRGRRRRAVRDAVRDEAVEVVLDGVVQRLGQALWHATRGSVRTVLRALDSLSP